MSGSEEYFDVVDARDAVIGRASRREVHARGLWHRAVHVMVFDAAGRVLLQRRSALKDVAPRLWASSCSGHVDAGEEYDPAALRELGEEIGVYLTAGSAPARWFRVEACEPTGWEFVWVYRLRHDGPVRLEPREIEEAAWHPPAAVDAWLAGAPGDICPSFGLIWQLVSARLPACGSSF
jgi:isopentenyl-diphosphate delta-isomerase type 1